MTNEICSSVTNSPRLIISSGEPAGIGPDLIICLAQQKFNAELTVIADPILLEDRAQQLGLPLRLIMDNEQVVWQIGYLRIIPQPTKASVHAGKLDVRNVAYVLRMLETACQGCLQNRFDAMITAPVQKSIINEAGYHFSGHTEYLAEISASYPVMMLANHNLKVALLTTHLPLSEVSKTISREKLKKVLQIIDHDLRIRFAIEKPAILVLGLNPHAGENGYLGKEEQDTIIPVLEELRQQGMKLLGPQSADTAFTPAVLENVDVVLAMYHDQGLPAFKALAFGKTVNITLGLPFIRSSVDHGTALSLAGSGEADSSSLFIAVQCAIDMVNRHPPDFSYG